MLLSPRCLSHTAARQRRLSSSRRRAARVAAASAPVPPSAPHNAPPAAVWGAFALVAGNTVGAGVLALPEETRAAGFVPATTALLAAWAFAVVTGLLLAEVCAAADAGHAPGSPPPSLAALATRTLGASFAPFYTAGVVFLHLALLVAYTCKAGAVLSSRTGWPFPVTASAFAASLAAVAGLCSPAQLDAVNGALLALLVAAFTFLLSVAAPAVDVSRLLATSDWAALPPSLAVISLSFVFHNVTPLVVRGVAADVASVRFAIAGGTALPLLLYLLWLAARLGVDPSSATLSAAASSDLPSLAADAFALLAVETSALGFVLSLAALVADALPPRSPLSSPASASEPPSEPLSEALFRPTSESASDAASVSPAPLAASLLPPLAASILRPDLFLSALDAAGAVGGAALFGALPAVMALRERSRAAEAATAEVGGDVAPIRLAPIRFVPGGDAVAWGAAALGVALVATDISNEVM